MKQEMVGGVPGEFYGTMADLFQKLRHGGITPEELKRFVKRENPFPEPPRKVWPVTSCGYTGEGLLEMLRKIGVQVTDRAIALVMQPSFATSIQSHTHIVAMHL